MLGSLSFNGQRCTALKILIVHRSLAERFPDEPFRQRFGFIAERLRHTRVRLLGERRGATTLGYLAPAEVIEDFLSRRSDVTA